jgi:threonyl-tRNA synthetase
MPKAQAIEIFKDNPFKMELIEGIPGDTVGISRQGDFYDLCRGGHVETTGEIKHFALTGLSGSYWRADKEGVRLQRISGTAFLSEEDMAADALKKEEAAKYDHRKLGKQQDLFSFHPEAVGFVFFHPKGKKILLNLENYLRNELSKDNYREIQTPLVMSDELWRQSGHYDFYKDNMYFTVVDEKSNALRPMNCPGSILIYKERPRSYRELPLKLAEFGHVHRYELSGVLHGLFRVRAFTIDDAHIYATPDQLEEEILKMITLIYKVYKRFDFTKVKVAVSTKPENAMGDDDLWQKATSALEDALKKAGIEYAIQEGEGAFYGPKIEFVVEDSMGREWQCGTIQVDFFQPINFDLTYISPEGKKERPVLIHRAIYGSLERFLGILTEHYKGDFPFWLAPIQIKILPITDDQMPYAQKINDMLIDKGIAVELDASSDPLSGKIKQAQLERVPWMLVLGKKEEAANTVTIRHLDGKQEFGVSLKNLVTRIEDEEKK